MRARGLPHDDRCCLCDQGFETGAHLALLCPFAKEVWAFFQDTSPRATQLASSSTTLCAWWEKLRQGKKDDHRKRDISVSVYVFWHIWKERGRRIFQQEEMLPAAIAGLVRADLESVILACHRAGVTLAA